jgi:putative FmdB family regulatory protein
VPTYQYVCTDCASDLEAVQSFSEPSLTECPTCGGKLRKKFGAVGVVFKGSGFYRNDSRSDRPGVAKTDSGEKTSSSDSSAKAETKSEPAAKSDSSSSTPSSSGSSGSSGSGNGGSSSGSGSGASSSSGTKTSSAA